MIHKKKSHRTERSGRTTYWPKDKLSISIHNGNWKLLLKLCSIYKKTLIVLKTYSKQIFLRFMQIINSRQKTRKTIVLYLKNPHSLILLHVSSLLTNASCGHKIKKKRWIFYFTLCGQFIIIWKQWLPSQSKNWEVLGDQWGPMFFEICKSSSKFPVAVRLFSFI